jgi:predicted DNA binding protein
MAQAIKSLPGWDFNSLVEVVGVRPLIESIGLKRIIQEFGTQRIIQEIRAALPAQEIGLQAIIAQLTPEQREILKQALAGGDEAGPTT